MESKEFIERAKVLVASADSIDTKESEVYTVWFNYTLGNMKAMLSTTKGNDMYYEVTFDKRKHQIYLDSYALTSSITFQEGN